MFICKNLLSIFDKKSRNDPTNFKFFMRMSQMAVFNIPINEDSIYVNTYIQGDYN